MGASPRESEGGAARVRLELWHRQALRGVFGIHDTPHAFRHATVTMVRAALADPGVARPLVAHGHAPGVCRIRAEGVRAGLDKYNPSVSQQLAKLEAERARRCWLQRHKRQMSV